MFQHSRESSSGSNLSILKSATTLLMTITSTIQGEKLVVNEVFCLKSPKEADNQEQQSFDHPNFNKKILCTRLEEVQLVHQAMTVLIV